MSEHTKTDNGKNNVKGLRIRTLSFWMVVSTIVISILIGIGIIDVMNHYQDLARMTNKYILSQYDVMDMSMGSDYLTEQVRLYAITKEYSYANAYFTEANVTQRRDKALEAMAEHLGSDDASLQVLADALKLSNELMDLEIHSMKLIALSVNTDLSEFPSEIQEYPLTEEELQYTSEEKADAAYELVFGSEYREYKQSIEETLAGVTDSVISVCSQRQAACETEMKNTLIRQSFYTALIVLLVVLAYVMIAVLILRPIRIYIKCIENNNLLEIIGAYEFKYLAITYNNIYEMSLAKQKTLRQKAEMDALTGLLNRQAFENLKTELSEAPHTFALLLIDVDVFKSINDTYGHDIGDQALIRTANLLKKSFRSVDHVLRIGGDEFAVIMENMRSDMKEIIKEKIAKINGELQHPQEDFPKYSISVGVSFSEKGYYDELFRQADHALYQTKENGRCGCTFYE